MTDSYDGFMSYSHAADGKLAPALQSGLHRLARPWNSLRALRIYRDKTSLSANPALWANIEAGLSQSRYLLLLASPRAGQSPWVAPLLAQEKECAQMLMGDLYINGAGVAQDYQKGFELSMKAAEKGNAEAQNSVGHMLYYRLGMARNSADSTTLPSYIRSERECRRTHARRQASSGMV